MANILQVIIDGDATGLNNSLSGAQKKLKNFGRQATQIGKDLSLRVTAPLAIAGAAAIKYATDTEESLNKVRVAFGDSSTEVEEFAKTTLKGFGIAQGTALDMAALFGDMATSMGINRSEAANLSTSLVGLAGDLASFKNMNIEEVTTALNGVFTGETESLKRLGVVMTQVNLENFAMSQGIQKNIKDMTQAEKVLLRYQFIMKNTTNAQGDFARTQDGAANQMRIFQEGLKELAASIGKQILPFFTKIVTKANGIIKSFSSLSPTTKKLIAVFALIAAAIPPIIIAIGSLSTALGALTAASGPVGLALTALALVIGNVVSYQMLKGEIKELTKTIPQLRSEVKKAKEDFDGSTEASLKLYNAQQKLLKSELELLKLQQDKEQGFIAKMLGIESDEYKRLGEEIKGTETKIKNYDMAIQGLQNSQLQAKTSTDELKESIQDLSGEIDVSKIEVFGAGAEQIQDQAELANIAIMEANENMKEIEGLKTSIGIDDDAAGFDPSTFDVDSVDVAMEEPATDGLDALIGKNNEYFQSLQRIKEAGQQTSQILTANFQNMAVGIGEAVGMAISGSGNLTQGLTQTLLQGVGGIATQLGQLAIGTGIAIKGIKKALTSLNPIAAIAGGVALIALGAFVKNKASEIGNSQPTAFAKGGIVSGPTLGLMGEYAGAKSNPEVIAPLDRLKSMMGERQTNVNVSGGFRLDGQDLILALDRANKNNKRFS